MAIKAINRGVLRKILHHINTAEISGVVFYDGPVNLSLGLNQDYKPSRTKSVNLN
ncbi:MAG: hypothetical protein AB7P13_05715 [Candidatus Nitrosocosmicus sp.]